MVGAPRGRRSAPGWGRAGRLAAAVAALALLAGCKADVSVRVEADAGGAGHVRATVELDREAVANVGPLRDQLRADDLEAAGWVVDGPTATAGGGARLRASKAFASPAGAHRALEELGPPFAALRLEVDRGLWTTKSSLRGTVDLSAGLAGFGDEGLTQLLGNPTLGLDPAVLEQQLGRGLDEILTFEVAARLPGRPAATGPATTRGGTVTWPVRFGVAVPIRATAERWNWVNLTLAGVAVVAGLSLAGLFLRRSRKVSWG